MNRKLYLSLVTLIIALIALTSVRATHAMPPIDPLAFFDPDETGWLTLRNQTAAAFQTSFNSYDDNYTLIDIEVDVDNGERRYSSVWIADPDNRGWFSHTNLTSQQFGDLWAQYSDDGYRLIDQEAYLYNGTLLYAGIWLQNVEEFGWLSYRNVSSAQFSDNFDLYKDDFMMIDFDVYEINGSGDLQLAAVWVENTTNRNWKMRRAMDAATFDDWIDDNSALGYRPLKVDSYTVGSEQRYGAILVDNSNNRDWAIYRDMSSQGYRNRWYQLRDYGLRVVDFERYELNGETRYAAVWRQSSARPDWSLRNEVDAIVESNFADYDSVGMSVAIAQNGEFKYMRGLGFADVDANKWYNSRTVNRLASVSKAVAGVMLLESIEDGQIANLNVPTRDLVPSLPAHHTHSVGQTVASRSGIGHYDELGWPDNTSIQHDTALDGAQLFEDDPLAFDPTSGDSCLYSSHAHNFLGAALEAASGQSIGALLNSQLTQPHALSSLKVEDRSVSNYHRSALYDSNNDEIVSPGNISWKILGGGLEASAYDLTRFGIKLLDGDILSQASLDTLWTPPTPCTNYAYGWSTGEEAGTQVVAKNGAQEGANTYIRIYPEKDIVIVVLFNRKSVNSAGDVGREIGAMLLENEPDINVPVIPATLAPAGQGDSPLVPRYVATIAGTRYTPLGVASLRTTPRNELVLDNIGDSGRDGVEIDLPQPALRWQAELKPAIAAGTYMTDVIQFTTEDANNAPISTLDMAFAHERDDRGSVRLTPSWPKVADGYQVQYLLDGRVVKDDLVAKNEPLAIIIGSGWDCHMVGGGPLGGPTTEICLPTIIVVACNDDQTDCTVVELRNADTAAAWLVKFESAQQLTEDDGSVIKFDSVRFDPPRDARSLAPATEIAAVSVNAAAVEQLTLTPQNSQVPTAVSLSSAHTNTLPIAGLLTVLLLTFGTLLLLQQRRQSAAVANRR